MHTSSINTFTGIAVQSTVSPNAFPTRSLRALTSTSLGILSRSPDFCQLYQTILESLLLEAAGPNLSSFPALVRGFLRPGAVLDFRLTFLNGSAATPASSLPFLRAFTLTSLVRCLESFVELLFSPSFFQKVLASHKGCFHQL